jgi:hypothetical protein
MDDITKIHLQSEYDIICARVAAREMARQAGFKVTDQARISMAVSSLAQKLGLGITTSGDIILDCIEKNGLVQLRVVLIIDQVPEQASMINSLERQRAMFMMDEMSVEKIAPKIRITATKWLETAPMPTPSLTKRFP